MRSRSAASTTSELEAAREAALIESRRGALAEAIDRHPDVAERVEKVVQEKSGKLGDIVGDAVPAAPATDLGNRGKGKSGDGMVEEQYIENLLNGGSSGSGGGNGQSFGVEVMDDVVQVTSGSQSWLLSEDDLEAVAEGQLTLPLPLENAIGAQGATAEEFATKVLKLID